MSKKYRKAVVGGTFDRFHLGHQHLINLGLYSADELLIGVTAPNMLKDKILTQTINSYDQRVQEINAYITKQGIIQPNIIPLSDPFGPTLSATDLDAIIVSPQTSPGAQTINTRRQASGLPPLAIEVSSMITDTSGEHLSSTRIRQGKVNRRGQVYQSLFNSDIHLTDQQKSQISQLQGTIINPNSLIPNRLTAFTSIALIGDQVTELFIKEHLPFHFAVIDHHVERRPHATNTADFRPSLTLTNPSGMITRVASEAIFNLGDQTGTLIEVNGEEDLLGFPFALSLPLNSTLFYGQPHQGLAQIILTETKKDTLAQLLDPSF